MKSWRSGIVEREAKRVIGTYDYDWAPLAESTKDERASLGFPEDEPAFADRRNARFDRSSRRSPLASYERHDQAPAANLDGLKLALGDQGPDG